jgi:hypothetical protein
LIIQYQYTDQTGFSPSGALSYPDKTIKLKTKTKALIKRFLSVMGGKHAST